MPQRSTGGPRFISSKAAFLLFPQIKRKKFEDKRTCSKFVYSKSWLKLDIKAWRHSFPLSKEFHLNISNKKLNNIIFKNQPINKKERF